MLDGDPPLRLVSPEEALVEEVVQARLQRERSVPDRESASVATTLFVTE